MRIARAAALGAFVAQLVLGQELKVDEQVLANGMKVLVHSDHDVPNVAVYFFYKIGSRNERPGTTGMSHFFEHMMFNGAKKYGPKQFDIEMERNGGRNNAYTSRDLTVYQDWVPASALELVFDMEADRIRDLALEPKMIESERGVVYSERRLRVDNDNFGLVYEQLNATAYLAHPYQWPVVGWASDIESWTAGDLRTHFRMGYAPNNCVLVVSGAVTAEEVLRLAKKYLEPIARQDPPPAVRTKEPPQMGERRVVIRKAAQAPLVLASFHVPPTSHADWYALTLLNAMLGKGRSSRLYRRLVDRDQVAIDVGASLDESIDPGQLLVSVQVRPETDPAAVEKALESELGGVAGVGAAELEKARNQVLADLYRTMRTINGKSNLIGQAEVFYGDWRKINTYAADLGKVTAADVERAAKTYLAPRNRTVATLVTGESK